MIRPQYHFRWIDGRLCSWDVRKLLKLAAPLPIVEVALSEISEIHEPYWFFDESDPPTCARVMAHAKQAEATDLSFPILLCADGRVMDGMHRIMKAYGLAHTHIHARKLIETPAPDFIDRSPGDLPYD